MYGGAEIAGFIHREAGRMKGSLVSVYSCLM